MDNTMLKMVSELIIQFFMYSFAGWCMEVILKYRQYHRFINRGFLIGPYCPIYGSGAVVITVFIGGSIGSFAGFGETFLASFIICGVLEYFVSWYMEKLFHARWWDYSQKPMNLHGRIWIGNLILFGLGGIIIVKLLNPPFFTWINKWPRWLVYSAAILVVLIMVSDYVASHILFNMVRKEIDGVDADNSEEVSTKIRALLRSKPALLRRIGDSYPTLTVSPEVVLAILKKHQEKLAENVRIAQEQLAETVKNSKEQITESMKNSKEQLTETVKNSTEQLTESVKNTQEQLTESFRSMKEQIQDTVEDKKEDFGKKQKHF
ncbi:MAG: hypothetical protein Q4C77_11935 [Eubacteriales bacterium]|nr:hypothetical protein [Eubacteriales bacterium]